MGLFGITLKKIEAIPGDIIHGAEDLYHDVTGGGSPPAPAPSSGAPASPAPALGGPPQQAPGLPRPNPALITPPPGAQLGMAPGSQPQQKKNNPAHQNPVGNLLNHVFVRPIEAIGNDVSHSIAGEGVKLGVAKLTGNPVAAQNAVAGLSSAEKNIIPAPATPNGNLNPAFQQFVLGATAGGEGLAEVPGEAAASEGARVADSAEPNTGEPYTTEQDVHNILQTNPLRVNEPPAGGEPLPTPPPGTPLASQPSPSDAELESLYKSQPQGPNKPPTPPPVNPDGTKVPTPNPNPQTYDIPEARPGDYRQGDINQQLFNLRVDGATQHALNSLDKLTPSDRSNFVNHAQGVTPISKAERPADVQTAVDAFRNLADMGHAAGDTTAPGRTVYKKNYFPGYYLDKDGSVKTTGSENYADLTDIHGYRSQQAKYENRQQALNAGEKPAFKDPSQDILRYSNGLKGAVGSNILKKGIQEADKNAPDAASTPVVLRDKSVVKVGKQGEKQLQKLGLTRERNSLPVAALKKTNNAVRQALISLGVPHALIIPRRAWGAAVEMKLSTAAAKLSRGMDDSVERPVIDNREAAIRMGTPIHDSSLNAGVKSTTNTTSTLRKINPLTIPKRLVFDHELPTIHNWLVGLGKNYVLAHGQELDSPFAREVGRQINAVMGYDHTSGALGQTVFAPALLKSTAKMYADAFRPGHGIARGAVIGEQLTNQMAGFVSKSIANQIMRNQNQSLPDNKQKQINKDTIGQTFLKNILNGGALYTPYQNSQKEQIMLRPTGEYQADALRALVNQESNGHGGTKFNIANPSQVVSNTLQEGRNIASPLLGDTYSAVKNQMFNGQHVYNPYSPVPQQIAQGATSIVSSSLPINVAGLINKNVEGHLPSWMQQSIQLNKSTPDNLKTVGSTFGLNPVGDTTTGNGPELQKFFAGQDAGRLFIGANSGSPASQADNILLFNKYFSHQKDNQGRTILQGPQEKASINGALAANPTVMKAVQLSEQHTGKGNYEPYWDLDPDKLAAYLTFSSLEPGSLQKDVYLQKNPWLSDIEAADNAWASKQQFSSNVVHGPSYVPYPQLPDGADAKLTQIGQISSIPAANRTPDQISQLNTLENDPDVQKAYSQLDQYTNQRRATYPGLTPINYNSKVSPQVQDWTSKYMAADSATRKSMKTSSPDMYSAMQQSLENQSLFDVEKQGGIGYLGGTPADSLLSGAYSLGQYDIAKGKNPNGTSNYSLENFGNGSAAAPPPLASQENLPTTTTPIDNGTGTGKSGSRGANAKLAATLSKVIANEKAASQGRDAEKAARAAARASRPVFTKSPERLRVKIKGTPTAKPPRPQMGSVSPVYVPKVKIKTAGNKAKLKVR